MGVTAGQPIVPQRQDGVQIANHPTIIWTNVGAGTLDTGPPDGETIPEGAA